MTRGQEPEDNTNFNIQCSDLEGNNFDLRLRDSDKFARVM